MNSIKVCEYSRSRSFHDDLILQDQASGERSQDQWSSGLVFPIVSLWDLSVAMETTILIQSAPKPNAINPPPQLWLTLNLIKIGLLASEIFFFEIVDGRRRTTTTDDGCLPIL